MCPSSHAGSIFVFFSKRIIRNEANVSAAQPASQKGARIPRPHEVPRRPPRAPVSPEEGAQGSHGLTDSGLTSPRPFHLETIKRGGEIDRASRHGRSYSSPLFIVVCLGVKDGAPRLAIKVSRKVGGAVVRNRIRRRVKDIARALFPRLKRPIDCVVIGRQLAATATFDRMATELEGLWVRHGVLPGSRRQDPRPRAKDDRDVGRPNP